MVHVGDIFAACIHLSRTWMSGSFESVRWNASAQTRPRSIHSSENNFGGMEPDPMLTLKEKSILPGKKSFSEEDRTHDAASRRTASPTHYQPSYSGPTRWTKTSGTESATIFINLAEQIQSICNNTGRKTTILARVLWQTHPDKQMDRYLQTDAAVSNC